MSNTPSPELPRSPLVPLLRRGALSLFLLASVVAMPGCALVNKLLASEGISGTNYRPPTVTATPVHLNRSPSMQMLAAYYCPLVITDRIARLGCTVALGSPPPQGNLVFEFGTTVTVSNPNNIPVPALDVLLALKMFQGQGAESLGAICVSMCGQNDPSCNGAPKPGACTSNQRTIRTMNDFVSAVPGLIAGLTMAAMTGELRKWNIAAGGNVQLNLNFQMGIDQALRVIQKVAQQYVQSMLQQQQQQLVIPVSGEGTVFVQLPGSGRIGVGFGPMATSWRIL